MGELKVYNKDMIAIGEITNATEINIDRKLNSLAYIQFSVPRQDPKRELLEPFSYVKYRDEYYRIMPTGARMEDVTVYNYKAEHALATLMDDIILGYYRLGGRGYYTEQVLSNYLSKQNQTRWKLGDCEFSRQFEYGTEQENLLAAIMAVPKPFAEKYKWEVDMRSFPWTLHLRKLETNAAPKVITEGYNLLPLENNTDYMQVCTRLFPLGYGEGINQLNIKEVNNGLPYIEASPEAIKRYGIINRVWVDRRYENPESLMNTAKAMLEELSTIKSSYQIDVVGDSWDIGDKVLIDVPELQLMEEHYIVGLARTDTDDVPNTTLTLSNHPTNIASTIADMADRQRIEMSYSQGATQIYGQSLQANADETDGAEIHFYLPEDMRIVNKVVAKIKTEAFRSYSKATKGGGGVTKTTSSGGGTTETTTWEGGTVSSTDSGGGDYTSETTTWDGNYSESFTTEVWEYFPDNDWNYGSMGRRGHNHGIPSGTRLQKYGVDDFVEFYQSGNHNHKFELNIPAHNHEVRINIPAHRHDFSIPGHNHSITIADHTHEIEPGIYRFGRAEKFHLYANNNLIGYFETDTAEIDVTQFLVNSNDGKIARGTWHSLRAVPDALSYISIDINIQGFVQSRGDHTL
ncbi:MAG: phage tail spike protein [Tissierellia bacterium]|nr:phage tail spike protein [Tissierellia bacterium]